MEPVPVEQATEIKTRHEQEWLKRPGVTGVDVGYRMVNGKPTKDVVMCSMPARRPVYRRRRRACRS